MPCNVHAYKWLGLGCIKRQYYGEMFSFGRYMYWYSHTKGISFFDCGASDSNRFRYFLHFTFLSHFFCVIVFMDYQVDTWIKFGKSGLAFAWFKRQLFYEGNQVWHFKCPPFPPFLFSARLFPSFFSLKLDGVGPIYNRPSTNKLHHFIQKKWHYMWHLTRDMWHVTHETRLVWWGEHSLKISAP